MKAKSKTGKNRVEKSKTHSGTPFKKVAGVSSLYRYVGKDGKKKDGNFYMIAKFVHSTGKKSPIKENLETTDLEVAKRKVLDTKDRRRNQTGEISLLNLCAEFKATRNGKNLRQVEWMIKKIKTNCPFKTKTVRKINPIEISKYVTSLKLKPRTNNLFFELLKSVFELGVIGGYLQTNPMQRLTKTVRKKVVRTKPNIPTQDQFKAIVQTIRNQKYSDTAKDSADLVEFLGLAALGEAEAEQLDWKDIDFEEARMNIQRKKTKVFFEVPIYATLKPFLENLHKAAGEPKSGRVFKVRNPKKAIETACKTLDFRKYTARNFRQMGIVNLLRHRVDYKLVSKWQGHQDGGILIIGTYSEVISDTDTDYEKEQLQRLEKSAV